MSWQSEEYCTKKVSVLKKSKSSPLCISHFTHLKTNVAPLFWQKKSAQIQNGSSVIPLLYMGYQPVGLSLFTSAAVVYAPEHNHRSFHKSSTNLRSLTTVDQVLKRYTTPLHQLALLRSSENYTVSVFLKGSRMGLNWFQVCLPCLQFNS